MQSQLESDYHFEVFAPHNNRKVLDLMLSIPNKLRDKNKPIIYKNQIKKYWPELLEYEINPKDQYTKIELKLKYYKQALEYKIKRTWKNLI